MSKPPAIHNFEPTPASSNDIVTLSTSRPTITTYTTAIDLSETPTATATSTPSQGLSDPIDGAIAGSVLGFIFIAIVFYYCCYWSEDDIDSYEPHYESR